ncbi:hypothetical protein JAAARDRAFT_38445 [Jaapia argillacea MUCL 33604]|uniref:Cytochrome b5 heme-binding domain-containing protein n=1 Tax=Jaapia argillacea MUCL 33604 TaxID=933084 RepID=A0A067PSL0_9AGAM|nr:hypothetical protein JAAARDRAFT_38445 [Jaapia argillacea MUCL 33604]
MALVGNCRMATFSLELVIYLGAILIPVAYLYRRHRVLARSTNPAPSNPTEKKQEQKSIMQAPRDDLAPPKDDPFTLEQLKGYDGSDESKPIYVSIKGTVFDVTHKKDVYGPGRSYNIFAGKDGSKGLGMSSLKPEHAVPDYSDLPDNELKVLNDWHAFFTKRYNVVGRVVDLPAAVANR